MARNLATDCFLTAQAIGHVAADEAKGPDPLAGHRLARSRADHVQTVLTGQGLPQNAIASVWDWQFQVAEPRVTLWVFELADGEDCAGEPLVTAKPETAPPAASVRTPVTPSPEVVAETPADPSPTAEAGKTGGEVVQPSADAAEPETARLTFDVNSSYFTTAQAKPLGTLLATRPAGKVRFDLTVPVGGEQDVEAKSPDNLAYNRWLAERRATRVRGMAPPPSRG